MSERERECVCVSVCVCVCGCVCVCVCVCLEPPSLGLLIQLKQKWRALGLLIQLKQNLTDPDVTCAIFSNVILLK